MSWNIKVQYDSYDYLDWEEGTSGIDQPKILWILNQLFGRREHILQKMDSIHQYFGSTCMWILDVHLHLTPFLSILTLHDLSTSTAAQNVYSANFFYNCTQFRLNNPTQLHPKKTAGDFPTFVIWGSWVVTSTVFLLHSLLVFLVHRLVYTSKSLSFWSNSATHYFVDKFPPLNPEPSPSFGIFKKCQRVALEASSGSSSLCQRLRVVQSCC